MKVKSDNAGKFIGLLGIRTELIKPGDSIVAILEAAFEENDIFPEDGDIVVLAESAVATAENRVVKLSEVEPGQEAVRYAHRFSLDPREMELVLLECDEVFGGVAGAALTITKGNLSPNAGIDGSNAPEGHVVLLPEDAQKSAGQIRKAFNDKYGCRVGIIIGDSRTQPMRLGCVGIALGTSGIVPVEDSRGSLDLFGKPLSITHKAVADNLVSAAQLVMGEAGERIPCVIIRNSGIRIVDADVPMPLFSSDECMYFSNIRKSPGKDI
ncbi:coenzyme F420-0:L-glutamate ligase [Methanohalophilus levihalophilus]|uniref:coenzyme F420-0:L-glutamate ligase n=1 Tax=Methanohalophilus levihalophilus TaxID=1431282 RepID=UPI001FDA1E2D|nr:coenzyme F420-0:L-glutamate ligase [Methanohalophilus levihalophilus]MBP2030577.1 coenzyme F420-0:L-glutamate ligase [Methanohalophilus levihalophilus]